MDDALIPLNPEKIAQLLSNDGPLAGFFDGYEEREGQLQLTKKITECFNLGGIGVFEAETGVGKSLAYLLPAIKWAVTNKCRVVISTATINLQQQLVDKDVPTALKIMDYSEDEVKTVLVKGRQNFLCLRRFHSYARQPDLFNEHEESLSKIKEQIDGENFSGSRAEFDFNISNSLWSNICSESDNCLGNRCSFFDACYVMKMKKQAEQASILIANHHLLFMDLSARHKTDAYDGTVILPSYSYAILDEAHAVEDAARSAFSENLNGFFLQKQVNALYKTKRGNTLGALHEVMAFSSREDLLANTVKCLGDMLDSYAQLEAQALALAPNSQNWSVLQAPPEDIAKLMVKVEHFYNAISAVNRKLGIILNNIEDEYKDETAVHQANVIARRLHEIELFTESFLEYKMFPEHVFWFDKFSFQNTPTIEFIKTPIHIGQFMNKAVFSPLEAVVCTSATLRIGENFNFWLNNTGLSHFANKPILKEHFDSPFPYANNVLFNIPIDAPLPEQPNFQDFVSKAVLSLIQAGNGRALVLFTSYAMLKETSAYVRKNMQAGEFRILCQGEDDRTRLLTDFKSDITSCLFATESFWAGVDVPGESLSHVILVKLPFEVPSHPVVQAKANLIEKNGGKAFFELSIPTAVIKFKQGFGRLMRSKSDKGIISVLDSRLLKKGYGNFFLKSVPKTRKTFAKLSEILYNVENFF